MNRYTLLALVSDVSGIDQGKICSKNRHKDLVRVRHLYYYFGRAYFGLSHVEMSRLLGAHHSSSIHAVYKVQNFIDIGDEYYCPLIDQIKKKINTDRAINLIVPYTVNLIDLYGMLSEYFPEIRIAAESLDTEQGNTLDRSTDPATVGINCNN